MTRHLLTTLEGDDQPGAVPWFGIMGKHDFHPSRESVLPHLPRRTELQDHPNPSTTQTPQSAPKSNSLFWIAALGVGLYLLTRKA